MMFPSGRRRDADQVALRIGQRLQRAPDEEEHAPRLGLARDRARDLATAGWFVAERCPGGVGLDDGLERIGERGAEHAVGARQPDEPDAPAAPPSAVGVRPAAARAPGRGVDGIERVVDRSNAAAISGASGLARASRIAEPLEGESSPTRVSIGLVVLERDDGAAAAGRAGPRLLGGGGWPVASRAARKRWRSPAGSADHRGG